MNLRNYPMRIFHSFYKGHDLTLHNENLCRIILARARLIQLNQRPNIFM